MEIYKLGENHHILKYKSYYNIYIPNKSKNKTRKSKKSKSHSKNLAATNDLEFKYMYINGGNGKIDVYKLTKTKKNVKGGDLTNMLSTVSDTANNAFVTTGNAVTSAANTTSNTAQYLWDEAKKKISPAPSMVPQMPTIST